MPKTRITPGRSAIYEVGMQLAEFPTSRSGRRPWAEILRLARNSGAIGEVRTPPDWSNVPKDCALRAVYLIDDTGPAIRWLIPGLEAAKFLDGTFHEQLENGDGHGNARSGWIKRHADGELEVL